MVPPTQETLISENPTKKTFILIPFQKGCQHSADNLSDFFSLLSYLVTRLRFHRTFRLIELNRPFDFTEPFVRFY